METTLNGPRASAAVGDSGWRYLLGGLRTAVPVGSMAQAADVAALAVGACGDDADGHLALDIRPGRVLLILQSAEHAGVTTLDVDLAHRVSAAVGGLGLRTEPAIATGAPRSVQLLEIAIDALDIASIRPFWKTLLGYADEPGHEEPTAALVDPFRQGPAVWFQQMDVPRAQRNRVHFDLCVPHDEALRRIDAALAAGGRLVSAERAPAFWVLADREGNEVCVTTWQGRDG
ncbi:4a-hydroxytetrahydrobiopterin dehydratase [Streptomyces sp. MBT42]|uniref:VOC family protein n=1 Tax=Streptomyces sp. MBT42 TaxID=1488373 RepID=UPI001E590B42|nr:VOC family protein [Streptomyces sp. MBT42]MCD2469056.1 4a-hydroxytetrahydrobiopterin dehydratase [Streptomyces sp. MBT42]